MLLFRNDQILESSEACPCVYCCFMLWSLIMHDVHLFEILLQALALIELYNAPEGRYKQDVYLLPKKMGELYELNRNIRFGVRLNFLLKLCL